MTRLFVFVVVFRDDSKEAVPNQPLPSLPPCAGCAENIDEAVIYARAKMQLPDAPVLQVTCGGELHWWPTLSCD